MSNTVLVIGVGVDKTEGINMPLANQLVPEIAQFAEEEGKEIEQITRSFLPKLQFTFNKFIETWHQASEWIKNADKIIVIGYSFNYADEHFNDIIRNNDRKEIFIIGPTAGDLRGRLSKIFGYRENDFTSTLIQEKTAFKCQNIKIIEANADEILLRDL